MLYVNQLINSKYKEINMGPYFRFTTKNVNKYDITYKHRHFIGRILIK